MCVCCRQKGSVPLQFDKFIHIYIYVCAFKENSDRREIEKVTEKETKQRLVKAMI